MTDTLKASDIIKKYNTVLAIRRVYEIDKSTMFEAVVPTIRLLPDT